MDIFADLRVSKDRQIVSEAEILPPCGTTNSGHLRLDALVAEIRRDIKDERSRALNIGLNLIECKSLLPHGNWRQWLRNEFDMSERSAQRYMSLVRATQRLCGQYGLDSPSLAYLPMDAVITLSNAPLNIRDEIARAILNGYRPSESDVFGMLFKRATVQQKNDLEVLNEELSRDTFRRDVSHEAARQAIEMLKQRFSDEEFDRFKELYRKAGVAFDLELFG